MALKKITLLVGGVGGAKLAYGLAKIMPPEDLTIIVNTGDDFWHYGLRISPDLDTIMYTLADLVDKTRGWGLAGDTQQALDALRRLGDTPWFGLGDQDLATHMLRTRMWHEGIRLTDITRHLTSSLGIQPNILPMADAPIATLVDTDEYGELGFQVYFVKHRWQPTLKGLRYAGAEAAQMTDDVRRAIEEADALIIGPSNPWLSISPILAVPGMRDLIQSRSIPRIAVTPIIKGEAVKGPTAKIMRELGLSVSPETVIAFYGDVINGFVYDTRDHLESRPALRTTGLDTYMTDEDKRVALAQNILDWLEEWMKDHEHLGNYPG
ncbi:MAG: 2-phospho-L-lactate transferase [Anaerolineae bacterium]